MAENDELNNNNKKRQEIVLSYANDFVMLNNYFVPFKTNKYIYNIYSYRLGK